MRIEISDNEPPKATDEIGYHDNNYYQSEYFVSVHYKILCLYSICSGRMIKVAFDNLFEFGVVKKRYKL